MSKTQFQGMTKTEGLFRISGSLALINEMKATINNGKVLEIPANSDPHAIAGLLKLYIRELPEPLFTFQLYRELASINPFDGGAIDKLKLHINSLPQDHRFVFFI